MSILDKLKEPFTRLIDFLETEKEIIKLKVIRVLGHLAGNLLAAIFMIVFFNVFLCIASIWLAMWLGAVLNSYAWGFGISVLIFLVLLVILIFFRKQLLVKPFENIVIQTTVDLEKVEEEKAENKEQGSAG